jgi:hypothetical protein
MDSDFVWIPCDNLSRNFLVRFYLSGFPPNITNLGRANAQVPLAYGMH